MTANNRLIATSGGGSYQEQLYKYSQAYKDATDILYNTAKDSGYKYELDNKIYPIIFLYRHYVELCLKTIYLNESTDCDNKKIDAITNHNLANMFGVVKPLINDLSKEMQYDDRKIISSINEVILFIDKYDRSSFNFRYPMDKKLVTTDSEPKNIDMRHFVEQIEKFYNSMVSIIGAFDAYNEYRKSHL